MPKAKEDFFVDADETEEASAGSDKAGVDQKKVEVEVKGLVSQIIKLIKTTSEDECDDDEVDSDDEPLDGLESGESSYRYVKCDSDYINEIIEKVILVLRQSDGTNHVSYLRLYQGQLCAYLKEALTKYENKRLVKCLEDILIDISDILCNELTFYSIMNCSNVIRPLEAEKKGVASGSSLNLIKSLAANKSKKNFEHVVVKKSGERSVSSFSERSESCDEEVYYFDEKDEKRRLECGGMGGDRRAEKSQIESNYSDILARLKMILNEKTEELNCMMALSEQLKERNEATRKMNFNVVDSADEEVVFHSPKSKKGKGILWFLSVKSIYKTLRKNTSS